MALFVPRGFGTLVPSFLTFMKDGGNVSENLNQLCTSLGVIDSFNYSELLSHSTLLTQVIKNRFSL